MKKWSVIVIGGVLFITVSMNVALAKSTAQVTTSVRVQMLLSKYDGKGNLVSPSYRVSFTTAANGRFSTAELQPAVFPQECSAPSRAPADLQQTGTQIEGTMAPLPDGRFRISLIVTVRTAAGCRPFDTVIIPVFSNRVISKDAVAAIGETVPTTLDLSPGEALRIDIRLTAE